MFDDLFALDRRTRFLLATLLALLMLLLASGGASRAEALSQPVVRLGSLLAIGIALYHFNRSAFAAARAPLIFLILLATAIGVQLVPVPPELWANLPGRSSYAQILDEAGLPRVWRPLSMAPDLTLNALLALLPVAAVILVSSQLPPAVQRYAAIVLLCGVLVSVLLGVLQISGAGLYLYKITNRGSGVGLFANQNHQAVFIACSLPLLAFWSSVRESWLPHRVRAWSALLLAGLLVPLVLITGSRSGLILTVLSSVLALLIAFQAKRRRRDKHTADTRLSTAIVSVVGLAAVAATVTLSRGTALERLSATGGDELRLELLPLLLRMIADAFPVGFGFGSFDPVYRAYEPEASLSAFYLNQAHADWLQLLLEGGISAAMLAAAFLGWFIVKVAGLVRLKTTAKGNLLAKTGAVIVFILLLASVGDYPLRTPLLSAVFALACYWVHAGTIKGGDVFTRHQADDPVKARSNR